MIAEQDYVIASPDLLLKSEEEFYELITQNTLRNIKLIVFNLKDEQLREIQIVPDFSWGGDGCLGCDVGSGMVHWIPKKSTGIINNNNVEKFAHNSPINNAPVLSSDNNPMTMPSNNPMSMPPNNLNNHIPIIKEDNFNIQPPQVKVPSARPVVDFNSPINNSTSNPTAVSQSIFPETSVQPTLAPPPIPSSASKPIISTAPITFLEIEVEDDIPKPNFSVPSDIVNQQ